MKLQKSTDQQILTIAKRFFYIGIGFLPLLWVVNVLWIGVHVKRNNRHIPGLGNYLWMSLAGAVFWLVVLISWILVYLSKASNLDVISAVIPKGQ